MDAKQLNDEGRAIWGGKARFWDALHGERGNLFHQRLIAPTALQLLDLRVGETVLDIGCGNGALARQMAGLGVDVSAIDFSAEMIELARQRNTADTAIHYSVVDATDESALLKLGARRYDAITCTMALMDMPVIAPLFSAASQLLKKSGCLVFATAHPAFNSNNPVFLQEKADQAGKALEQYAIKIYAYLEMPPVKGAGAPGEPLPHIYYHRPLSALLSDAFEAGFVLDALLEPAFTQADADRAQGLTWAKLTQIPPVLTGRLRLPA
ncbi:MAG: methyltransferase domain-containing protein [Chloroflexi bacterium]|nr:methyltransferase domain-containing protein [Chloroflexota bacterium]MYC56101.1 methyltransferase domain-containing protein [Chloroflexota bacterium]